LLKSIREYRNLHVDRTPWAAAEHILDPFLEHLRAAKGIDQLAPAGSFRRCRETIGDLDILATVTGDPAAVITHFVRYPRVVEVLAEGDTKASVVLKEKLQVDLRVVETDAFGAALQYFTGSKEHNVALRSRAKDGGLKVSEYGVFRGDSRIAGKSEEDVYAALGLEWIPPELRENRGEIDAAADHKLPKLVTLEDIKGDLHAHSTYTDGTASIAEMAAAARKRGYSYLAITDHSKAVTIAHGLDAKRVRQQLEEIKAVRATLKGFHLLSGIEVDILGDGSLDLPDDVLAELDWVVASVHSKFDLDEAAMTKRIIRALGNPHVNCIGHPTGRLIGQRGEYRVDLHAVIKAAAAHHTALEINAAPERLDLNDHYAYLAREAGVPLAISTDAHHPASFSDARYGINMARRAWCTARDILNAWPWETFSKWLHK
ncbi:DNA polymerase/3'-5' exonuclease PolX, partial [bacterium]|nr:DNA polymerase/3'-5' exonuclease PolX [bacterium]